jgi:hypothetical protein
MENSPVTPDAEELGSWLGARCRSQGCDLSARLVAVEARNRPAL